MTPKLAGAIAASFLLGAGAGATGGELLTIEPHPTSARFAAEDRPDPVEVEAEKVTEGEALAAVRTAEAATDCDALEAAARSSARLAESACAAYQAGLAGDADLATVRKGLSACEVARATHATDQETNLACRDGLRLRAAVYERKARGP